MFSAISRTNAVLHCAACSKLRGGTKRVLVRPGTDALAIAAIPQTGTLALPRSTTALRMITPILAIRQRCSVGAAEFTTTVCAAWPAYHAEARAAAPIGSHIREREFTRSFLLLRGARGEGAPPRADRGIKFCDPYRGVPASLISGREPRDLLTGGVLPSAWLCARASRHAFRLAFFGRPCTCSRRL